MFEVESVECRCLAPVPGLVPGGGVELGQPRFSVREGLSRTVGVDANVEPMSSPICESVVCLVCSGRGYGF